MSLLLENGADASLETLFQLSPGCRNYAAPLICIPRPHPITDQPVHQEATLQGVGSDLHMSHIQTGHIHELTAYCIGHVHEEEGVLNNCGPALP